MLQIHGSVSEISLQLRRPDKVVLPVLMFARTAHRASGHAEDEARVYIAMVAIGSRQALEQELLIARRQAEQNIAQFRMLADASPAMVLTVGAHGAVQYCNRRWQHYTGLSLRETAKRGLLTVLHPDGASALVAAFQEVHRPGDGSNIHAAFTVSLLLCQAASCDGRWHNCHFNPILDSRNATLRWVITAHDVHDDTLTMLRERTQAQALARSHEALRERLKKREQFVATLTHDLLSPMSAAQMTAQTLMDRSDAPHLQRQAKRIIATIGRASRMAQDLLDTKLQTSAEGAAIDWVDCDAAQLVQTLIEDRLDLYQHRVQCLAPQAPLNCAWQPDLMTRAVDNLIKNALKYGAAGAPVTVKVWSPGRGSCAISVHNTGPPIPAGEQQRIFLAYERAEAAKAGSTQGWGLGLAQVQNALRAHYGRVELVSNLAAGTTFTLFLSCAPAEHA